MAVPGQPLTIPANFGPQELLTLIDQRLTAWDERLGQVSAAIEPHANGSQLRAVGQAAASSSRPHDGTPPSTDHPGGVESNPLPEAVAGLEQLHQERDAILALAAQMGFEATSATGVVAKLIEAVPSVAEQGKALFRRLKSSSTRLAHVRGRSLSAWVLARRAMLHNDQMLRVLTDGGAARPTYGRPKPATSHGAIFNRCA